MTYLKVKLLIIFEEASGYVEKYSDIRSPLRRGQVQLASEKFAI